MSDELNLIDSRAVPVDGEPEVTIEFRLPSRHSRGFLRRMRTALEFQQAFQEEPTLGLLDKMKEFFLPYVTVPGDRQAAWEALEEMSEDQYDQLLSKIAGQDQEPPLEKSEPSGAG